MSTSKSKEQLPQPDVIIPKEPETLRLMLIDQRLEWLGALTSVGRGSYDGGRKDRQARANLNHLLDHFPAGTPRDHIVQYYDRPAMVSDDDLTVPGNVVLGD